mmetsp:Transcript_53260/g.158830  ORF Transcript_53260/g.158830 Transcript_53260/m.158830 type:complete len:239 (+) Transcript_53260:27-743(+)
MAQMAWSLLEGGGWSSAWEKTQNARAGGSPLWPDEASPSGLLLLFELEGHPLAGTDSVLRVVRVDLAFQVPENEGEVLVLSGDPQLDGLGLENHLHLAALAVLCSLDSLGLAVCGDVDADELALIGPGVARYGLGWQGLRLRLLLGLRLPQLCGGPAVHITQLRWQILLVGVRIVVAGSAVLLDGPPEHRVLRLDLRLVDFECDRRFVQDALLFQRHVVRHGHLGSIARAVLEEQELG